MGVCNSRGYMQSLGVSTGTVRSYLFISDHRSLRTRLGRGSLRECILELAFLVQRLRADVMTERTIDFILSSLVREVSKSKGRERNKANSSNSKIGPRSGYIGAGALSLM